MDTFERLYESSYAKPPLHEIEKNVFYVFDTVDDILKKHRVSKADRGEVLSQMIALFANACNMAEVDDSDEMRENFKHKMQSYLRI